MTIQSGDYLRVTCNFELGDGTQYQNIYSYTRDGEDPYSDANHVIAIKARVEAMYATIIALVKSDTVEQLSFVDRVEWVVDEWKVVENIGTFVPTFNPAAVGDALPHQCAPFLIFKTTRPKSVGKKFLFPFDEAQQADSILVGGAVTAMVAFGVLAIDDIPLVGVSTLLPGIMRTGVQQWLTFQVAVVNDVIGTQRRRRPGVGA